MMSMDTTVLCMAILYYDVHCTMMGIDTLYYDVCTMMGMDMLYDDGYRYTV